jgi:hypothetical protein
MNRNDLIELILDHAIQSGVYSELFMDRLRGSSDSELAVILEKFEDAI